MFSKQNWTLAMLLFTLSSPCFAGNAPAQTGTSGNQPKPQATTARGGELRARETKLESKLQSSLEAGKIDSDGLAGYQDRFNELRAKEEELRSGGAMTNNARQDLMHKMDELEADFDKDVQERAKGPKETDDSNRPVNRDVNKDE